MFIGFTHIVVTGDNSTADMGIEFDKTSICEYVAKDKVVTVYEPKNEDAPQDIKEAV
jgi:hypothetical protein